MKEKKLLIVERSNASLKYSVEQVLNENNEHSDSIVLTGLFTSFNTKNRNGRIYESADFLPHVEALREQMESKRLLGELDHPHGFEVSLGNVSHVVESLEYDPQQNAIVGKIRLLNTSKGKEAQALVRDGIPLNISSRAAGTVDESGHVRLQQLFTYDLVADPGFANAQLKRVNESYGFGDDKDIDIYDISEDANTKLEPGTEKKDDYAEPQAEKNANSDTLTNKTDMEDNNKTEFISYSDFQKYSEHLAEIAQELQSAIANIKSEIAGIKDASAPSKSYDSANVDNSMIADMVAKEVAKCADAKALDDTKKCDDCKDDKDEKISELTAKAEKMEENLNKVTAYTKYLAETLDKSITHQDYIVEEANKMISHQDYLAENMNKMIAHQDYLAENINDTIAYQEYIAENLDKSIDYSNMLAEEANKTIAHNDYLVEKMNQMIDHQDYIVENVNKMSEGLIEEKKDEVPVQKEETVEKTVEEVNENTETSVEEQKPTLDVKKYNSDLNEKLDAIMANARAKYAESKQREMEAIEESKKAVVDPTNFTLINYLPARLNERWSKLSDERKKEILAESKMFVINNEASATLFWNTRDLREKQIEIKKIDESKTAVSAPSANEGQVSNDYLESMKARIQRNMRAW